MSPDCHRREREKRLQNPNLITYFNSSEMFLLLLVQPAASNRATSTRERSRRTDLYERVVQHSSVLQACSRNFADNGGAAKRMPTWKRSHETTILDVTYFSRYSRKHLQYLSAPFQFPRPRVLFPAKRSPLFPPLADPFAEPNRRIAS